MSGLPFLVFWVAVGAVYFLPALIAYRRRVPRAGLILAANLAFGWTVIGWILLYATAVRPLPVRKSS